MSNIFYRPHKGQWRSSFAKDGLSYIRQTYLCKCRNADRHISWVFARANVNPQCQYSALCQPIWTLKRQRIYRLYIWALVISDWLGENECMSDIRTVTMRTTKHGWMKMHGEFRILVPGVSISVTKWVRKYMMTSSNGNIFRFTGLLCGEFTGPRWIPPTKASDAELW